MSTSDIERRKNLSANLTNECDRITQLVTELVGRMNTSPGPKTVNMSSDEAKAAHNLAKSAQKKVRR